MSWKLWGEREKSTATSMQYVCQLTHRALLDRYRDKRKKELEELQGLLTTLEAAYNMMKASHERAVAELETVTAEKRQLAVALVESERRTRSLELTCRSLEGQVMALDHQVAMMLGRGGQMVGVTSLGGGDRMHVRTGNDDAVKKNEEIVRNDTSDGDMPGGELSGFNQFRAMDGTRPDDN